MFVEIIKIAFMIKFLHYSLIVIFLIFCCWGCSPKYSEINQNGFGGGNSFNYKNYSNKNSEQFQSKFVNNITLPDSLINNKSISELNNKEILLQLNKPLIKQNIYVDHLSNSSVLAPKMHHYIQKNQKYFPSKSSGFLHWFYTIFGLLLLLLGIYKITTFKSYSIILDILLYIYIAGIFLYAFAAPYVGYILEKILKRKNIGLKILIYSLSLILMIILLTT